MFAFPSASGHLTHHSSNVKPTSIETIHTNHNNNNHQHHHHHRESSVDKDSSLGKFKYLSTITKQINTQIIQPNHIQLSLV
jgi:hypothetical protein